PPCRRRSSVQAHRSSPCPPWTGKHPVAKSPLPLSVPICQQKYRRTTPTCNFLDCGLGDFIRIFGAVVPKGDPQNSECGGPPILANRALLPISTRSLWPKTQICSLTAAKSLKSPRRRTFVVSNVHNEAILPPAIESERHAPHLSIRTYHRDFRRRG